MYCTHAYTLLPHTSLHTHHDGRQKGYMPLGRIKAQDADTMEWLQSQPYQRLGSSRYISIVLILPCPSFSLSVSLHPQGWVIRQTLRSFLNTPLTVVGVAEAGPDSIV